MGFSFIIGRAGSGKTHRCLSEIARHDGDEKLILLVPEQATFQMEKAIHSVKDPRPRVEVLSFRRLAWRVFSETGGPGKQPIDEVGKRMVLRAIAQRNQKRLSLFSRTSSKPGFIEALSSCLKEFAAYNVTVENLEKLAACSFLGPFLAQKISDLKIIYDEYSRFIENTFTDPDRVLSLLAEKIPKSRVCRGARVWVDGFTGFTPQEMAVLEALGRTASSVTITLTLDPLEIRSSPEDSIFAPTLKTLARLGEMAAAAGIPVTESLILAGCTGLPRFDSAELGHLEAQFGKPDPVKWPSAPEHIVYLVCPSKESEVEVVATQIISLARDRGYRWNDIAVLVHDLAAYRETVESVFLRRGIPVFIDARKPVVYHPLIEAVRAILEIITEEWPTDAVLRLLKTDLVRLPRDDVDRLENFVLARGIIGSMWRDTDKWGDEFLAGLARQALLPVAQAERALAPGWDLGTLISAITSALVSMKVEETLLAWSKQSLEEGDIEQASLNAQVYDGVMLVLRQASETLGHEVLTPSEARQILETGLAALDLGMVPPSLDQVVVGSLDRSRHPKVRAAFVLGLVEGGFPRPFKEDPVFTDSEREKLAGAGLELAPSGSVLAIEQDFLAYLALTRSSELLFLTRPLADASGRPLAESPLISKVRKVFPLLAEKKLQALTGADGRLGLECISDLSGALSLLASHAATGRPMPRICQALLNWLKSRGLADRLMFIDKARKPNTEPPLGPSRARELFGECLDLSLSRLESFLACPFQHFAGYGLRLKQRKTGRIDPAVAGQFMHSVMSHFVRDICVAGQDLGGMGEAQVAAFVETAADKALGELSEHLALDNPHIQAELSELKDVVLGAALVLAEHARRGAYRLVAAELSFGPEGRLRVPELVTPGGTRVSLKGRIDLLDTASDGDVTYFRVIDLKSRPQQLRIQDIMDGIDLQLVGYLAVLTRFSHSFFKGEARPAAILYFPLRENFSRLEAPPDTSTVEKLRLSRRRMSGLISGDTTAIMLMDKFDQQRSDLVPVSLNKNGEPKKSSSIVKPEELLGMADKFMHVLVESAERIAAGEVAILPYRKKMVSACDSCSFSAVCAFDTARPENRYRLPGFWTDCEHNSGAAGPDELGSVREVDDLK